jgi:hypothetical protein
VRRALCASAAGERSRGCSADDPAGRLLLIADLIVRGSKRVAAAREQRERRPS